MRSVEDLEAISKDGMKQAKEKYHPIEGKVLEVMGMTSQPAFSEVREQVSNLSIKIDNPSKVKFVTFKGCWPIEKGDYIRAFISLYEVKPKYEGDKGVYKDLTEGEPAEMIQKIRNNEVVATYYNID